MILQFQSMESKGKILSENQANFNFITTSILLRLWFLKNSIKSNHKLTRNLFYIVHVFYEQLNFQKSIKHLSVCLYALKLSKP